MRAMLTIRQNLYQDRHGPADRAPTTIKRMPQRWTYRRSKIKQHRLQHSGSAVTTCKQPTGIAWI
eukprot:6632787-Pyramimonas_sp.AAC.2